MSAAGDGNPALSWRRGHAAAVSPDDAEVWLFGGGGPVRLAGRGAGPLARAVNGQRTVDDIVASAAQTGMAVQPARSLLQRWLASGHLEPASAEPGGSPRVHVEGPDTEEFVAALAASGLVVSSKRPDVRVLVVEDLLDVESAVPPDVEYAHARATIVVQLRGDRALVSPVFGDGNACAACLAARLRLRRHVDLVAARRVGRTRPPASPIVQPAAALLAAGVVAALVHEPEADRAGEPCVVVIDPVRARVTADRIVPVSGCSRCDVDGPTVLTRHLDATVGPGVDGSEDANAETGSGLRSVDPDVTWQRFAHLISDVVGVVPGVEPTGRPEMRAFSAGPNLAGVDDPVVLRSRLRSLSGGKGTTVAAARTSALAEALERDALRARGSEPHVRARMADLSGAVHPNAIQLFSARQLARAEQLHALQVEDPAAVGHHRVPLPFDVDAEHDWSQVRALGSAATYWLPSAMLWLNWPGRQPLGPTGSSNGAAAGNTVAEALLQGLLELVERDSVALWWYPRCHRPAIDLAAWDDPRIHAALAPQRALGTDVWVLDITTDLGIPAAVAVARGAQPVPDTPLMGFGAHLDPVIAVVRALTELAQMQAPLTQLAVGAHVDLPGPAERIWFDEVTPEREPWLMGHGVVSPRRSPTYATVGEALADVVARLTNAGLEPLWADCTRPDVGLPVVRTWAPGLRHFWARLAPGRLYDVPPALGWCAAGYGEDDLNPLAMIL